MSAYDSNIYYNPNDAGLSIVDSLDQAGAWEFDIILFLCNEAGEVRVFTDSGCSCPTPFEGFSWDDGEPIRNADHVELAVARWWDRERYDGGVSLGEVVSLRRCVIDSL